ncbi:PREDICTED: uncharacterized protein LOC105552193 [Mandrillus leucophaeus]|uniref:uncharacterized protein LOC105552193 n=1 Tax=Mandrillus leucophaeus TaxID=9568 RepID=UPI0005F486DB|nr:PREDICTED: uncharacterized protein LOC105552193 [Mandrillus leucophaeus]
MSTAPAILSSCVFRGGEWNLESWPENAEHGYADLKASNLRVREGGELQSTVRGWYSRKIQDNSFCKPVRVASLDTGFASDLIMDFPISRTVSYKGLSQYLLSLGKIKVIFGRKSISGFC